MVLQEEVGLRALRPASDTASQSLGRDAASALSRYDLILREPQIPWRSQIFGAP